MITKWAISSEAALGQNVQRLELLRLVAPSGAKCITPIIKFIGWRYSLDCMETCRCKLSNWYTYSYWLKLTTLTEQDIKYIISFMKIALDKPCGLCYTNGII